MARPASKWVNKKLKKYKGKEYRGNYGMALFKGAKKYVRCFILTYVSKKGKEDYEPFESYSDAKAAGWKKLK